MDIVSLEQIDIREKPHSPRMTKYRAESADGTSFFVRSYPLEQQECACHEWQVAQLLDANEIPMCRPIAKEVTASEIFLYYEWLEGVNLHDFLLTQHNSVRYDIGTQAAHLLKKIHSITHFDATLLRNNKAHLLRRVQVLKEYTLPLERYEEVISCLQRKIELDANSCIVHEDFAALNVMFCSDNELRVIDFELTCVGTYGQDFNRAWAHGKKLPYYFKGLYETYFGLGGGGSDSSL